MNQIKHAPAMNLKDVRCNNKAYCNHAEVKNQIYRPFEVLIFIECFLCFRKIYKNKLKSTKENVD